MWINWIGFGRHSLFYPHSYFIDLIEEEWINALNSGVKYIPPTAIPDNDTTIDSDTIEDHTETTTTGFWDNVKTFLTLSLSLLYSF